MFWTRLFSGIILVLIALVTVITGGNVLLATIALISLIGMMELMRVAKANKTALAVPGFGVIAVLELFLLFDKKEYILPMSVIYLLVLLTFYVVYFPKFSAEQVMYLFFGLFYVGIMLSYIYQVRMLPKGQYLVWLIFIGAWGSDTCAYATGKLFGKHKATPELSPKKTWEGCIGGVIGAALLSFLYGIAMNGIFHQTAAAPAVYALISACAAVISQFGDLAASAIKRNNGIKDYGKLIPGHGGILDRFDSIIFVAPLVYYLSVLFA